MNIEKILEKVKYDFSEEKVCKMFDDEILNWVESDWEENYDCEYDWYMDHNNGEAQDVIIERILNSSIEKYSLKLDSKEYTRFYDLVKESYDPLNYS